MNYKIDKKKTIESMEEMLENYISPTFVTNRFQFVVGTNEASLYEHVWIEMNTLDDDVTTKMNTSTSIIKFSGNSDSNGYEKRLISVIQTSIEEEKWIRKILSHIEKLNHEERHYLIAKYVAKERDYQIKKSLHIKSSASFYRLKSNALLHLGLVMPDRIRLKVEDTQKWEDTK